MEFRRVLFRSGIPVVVCGGAGGKTNPLALRAGDLSAAVNDALLSKLRNTLRRQHRYPKASDQAGKVRKRVPKMGVRALWFDQPALLPAQWLQAGGAVKRSEEHTSELQSLMRISYAVFCLKKTNLALSPIVIL